MFVLDEEDREANEMAMHQSYSLSDIMISQILLTLNRGRQSQLAEHAKLQSLEWQDLVDRWSSVFGTNPTTGLKVIDTVRRLREGRDSPSRLLYLVLAYGSMSDPILPVE